MIKKSFGEFLESMQNNLNELRFSYIYRKTPKRYKDRAKSIKVRFLTKTKQDKYFYETTTLSNGNKHRQWIQLWNKNKDDITLENLRKHVIVHCDCNDFRYENEWLLWKKNASNLISSNKQPLKRMNPQRIPKFCKHLSAIKKDFFKRMKGDK